MKVYNQNKSNDFWADCTIFAQIQILTSMYWVQVKYWYINKIVDSAIKALVLFTWGAVFETIYNWNVAKLSKILWVNLRVRKTSITSAKFESLTNDWYFWGVWLRNWNKTYLEAVSRWVITKKDIDAIAFEGWGFNHNNVYGKWVIQEVYKWKEVKCSLEVLRYWISKKVFWSVARSIEWSDKFARDVWSLLIRWKEDNNYDPYQDGKRTHHDILVNNKAWEMLQYKI